MYNMYFQLKNNKILEKNKKCSQNVPNKNVNADIFSIHKGLAQRTRFELVIPLSMPVFGTGTFDHSDISAFDYG